MGFVHGNKRVKAGLLVLFLLLSPLYVGAENEVPEPENGTRTATQTETPGTLAAGAKGEEVVRLQTRLKELGYLKGEADGDFGNATRNADPGPAV